MLCAVIKGPTYQKAQEQIQQASKTADIVELRLDYFDSLDEEKLIHLKNCSSIPVIFALRQVSQGGAYPGTENERLSTIERLAALNPAFLDIEYSVATDFVKKLQKKHPQLKIIVSFHDFEKTPSDLNHVLAHLKKIPAALYKIATMASSSSDALRQLHFFRNAGTKFISVSMGEAGQFSRVLSPIVGSYLTYGFIEEEQATAAGQMSIPFLKDVYRYHSLKPATAIYGLIGDPVDKSLSHITHNAVMNHFGIDAVYVKMPVKAEELKEFFPLAKQLEIRGLSVTMPLKEQLFSLLDHVDSYARCIGAVNTVLFEEGKLSGYNTDCIGALDAIEEQVSVKDKTLLMIGAGGAAKAIAYEAVKRGARLIVLNRDPQKAYDLARQLKCAGAGLDAIAKYQNYDIIVNATPHEMPIDAKWFIPGTYAMDIKTRPKETPFLINAMKCGCYPIYGYRMFIYQAVQQWNLWFQNRYDPKVVKEIIEAKMEVILAESSR